MESLIVKRAAGMAKGKGCRGGGRGGGVVGETAL
jgi:hypothetical protein